MTINEERTFELAQACLEVIDILSKLGPHERDFVVKFAADRCNQRVPNEPLSMPNPNGNGKRQIGRPRKVMTS